MTDPSPFDPVEQLSRELELPGRSVAAVLGLFAEGATVPFIARYRKEATGGLDEVQIRAIEERHGYLKELHERKQTVLQSIADQDKLTDELRERILACDTKTALEDLYLPYRPKRRTRATIAREKGLEPLADLMWAQDPDTSPEAAAPQYVDGDKGVEDVDAALAGARDICAERVSEDADVRRVVREVFQREGVLRSEVAPAKKDQRTKFEQYYDFTEPVREIPSHRFLAVRRGEREEVLRTHITVDAERTLTRLIDRVGLRPSPWQAQLRLAVEDGFRRLLAPSLENDVRSELKVSADNEAVGVFASNLRNLLLAPPAGQRAVVGIDPGLRTGCKCVAVDATGKYLDTITIYPSRGGDAEENAKDDLLAFVLKHRPWAVAVGNGTAGRETEAFTRKLLTEHGHTDVLVLLVSESGASVYSASDVARAEFPDLDVTVRGAISIARRLQDPLAELVKIDPKSIGVGQYQHDVNQTLLKRKLDDVVESCVNHVGVELNTASAPLLSHVAGIGASAAQKIITHRETHGAFSTRQQLLGVSGVGPRTFEQAAGFLRIRGGEHPLDASAVHPERYELVERIARDLQVSLAELVGDPALADRIDIQRYTDDEVGEPTLRDILAELKKPGRDPREAFEPPKFREDVNTLEDLKPGMTLEGVVTNVTHFGAFVDVGVKQDGLVHISQLSDHFVKDPAEVAKVGDKLTVRVLEVDTDRKRISLSCRSEDAPQRRRPQPNGARPGKDKRGGGPRDRKSKPAKPKGGGDRFSYNPFADLLKK